MCSSQGRQLEQQGFKLPTPANFRYPSAVSRTIHPSCQLFDPSQRYPNQESTLSIHAGKTIDCGNAKTPAEEARTSIASRKNTIS